MSEIDLDNIGNSEQIITIEKLDTNESLTIDIKNDGNASDGYHSDLDLLMDPKKSKHINQQDTFTNPGFSEINVDKNKNDTSNFNSAFKSDIKPIIKPISKHSSSQYSTKKTNNTSFEKENVIDFDSLDLNINAEKLRYEDTTQEEPIPSFHKSPDSNSFFSNQKKEEDHGLEKQDLLFKLKRFEMRGIPMSRKFSLNSDINDMREEYTRIKAQRDIENSIRFQRKTLMAFVSGTEFVNAKFDPLDVKLDGWSESIHENLTDYDEIFEELHEKYKTKTKVAPELKLLMMLGGSAVMFHMTNTLFKNSMPGMDDILKQNPDLAKQFAEAAINSTQTGKEAPGFGNMVGNMVHESTSASKRNRGPPPPQPSRQQHPDINSDMSKMSGPSDDDVNRILNQIHIDDDQVTNENNFIDSIHETESILSSTPSYGKKKRGRPSKKNTLPSFDLNI
jgi:uncharacterized protein YejL (UPF0352 family)